MCATTIQNNSETSSNTKDVLVKKSDDLIIESLDFSMQSNISVVANATTAYSLTIELLSATKKSLETDAKHIESMGKQFEWVDAAISKSFEKLL